MRNGDVQPNRQRDLAEATPKDFDDLGIEANYLLYQYGPSQTVVLAGLQQHTPPTESALAQTGIRFARSVDTGLKRQITEGLGVLPETDQEIAATANRHQSERRNLIIRSRDTMAREIWTRAAEIVKSEPDRALEIFQQDQQQGKLAMLRAITLQMPTMDKGPDYFMTQVHLVSIQIARQLKATFTAPGEVNDDQLTLLAVEQWGGMPLLLTCAIAYSMVAACGPLTDTTLYAIPGELAERAIDGRLPIVTEDIAGLDFWGMYRGFVQTLARTPISQWPELAYGITTANAITDEIQNNAKYFQQLLNRAIRAAERDNQRLNKRLHDTEIQLAGARRALDDAKAAKTAPAAANANDLGTADESAQLRRTIERQRQELEEKSAALDGVQELLDAVLSDPAPAPDAPQPLTREEIKTLRGVIIGGHQVLHNKLRKLLPKCTFYSADQKRIDDTNLRESQFVIFFTGYCNHALADNALRVCRRYEIPTGYSAHVNPERFLQDIAKIIGRGE